MVALRGAVLVHCSSCLWHLVGIMIDRFHKAVYEVVAQKITTNADGLIQGGAMNYEEYKRQVGYIRALYDVLEWCASIERDMYGGKKEEDL